MTPTRPFPLLALSTSARLVAWVLLVIIEMLAMAMFLDFKPFIRSLIPIDYGDYGPAYIFKLLRQTLLLAIPMFALLTWSRRQALALEWSVLTTGPFRFGALARNLALLLLFATISLVTAANTEAIASQPFLLRALLGVICLAIACSMIDLLSPFGDIAAFIWRWRGDVARALALGAAIILLAVAGRSLWEQNALVAATLHASSAILNLYEPAVLTDAAGRAITVGSFTAIVNEACSGIEGFALIAGFVTLYLWTFRAELSFPLALLLYPIGLAASFALNAARIAALTSIGAHVSPEVAVAGFHSQAGWIAFLLVTFGLITLSFRLTDPSRTVTAQARARPPERYTETSAYLTPFIALMIGSIAVSAATPHDQPVYVLKVLLAAFGLWLVRHALALWRPHVSAEAVGAGLAVGIVWIATEPSAPAPSALAAWLVDLGPLWATAWLIVRAFGTIILVPLTEELAFRGYLYRRLISRDFYAVDPARFSWLAFILSSALFGLLHDRWLLGIAAGGVFALVMLRRGRLGDAITAHAIANALIFIWALAFRHWTLL